MIPTPLYHSKQALLLHHPWRSVLAAGMIWITLATGSAGAYDQRHKPSPAQPKMWLIVPQGLIPPQTKLHLTSVQGEETLSRSFAYNLTLTVVGRPLNIEKILGQNLTVALNRSDGIIRYINGYATEISFTPSAPTPPGSTTYFIQLTSWLFLLRNNADMQLYQNMTVPQIMSAMFKKYPFARVQFSLSKKYPVAESYTQYRETDLNFISRTLEHVGIYYYFKHGPGSHTLVLTDQVPYTSKLSKGTLFSCATSHSPLRLLQDWTCKYKIQPSHYTLKDYNYHIPHSKELLASARVKPQAPYPFEVYDYPGEYTNGKDAQFYARVRLQELRSEYFSASASSESLEVSTGDVLNVRDCPVRDHRARAPLQQYVISSSTLTLSQDIPTPPDNTSFAVKNELALFPADTPFSPSRITPKPLIDGNQTAIVVGPPGKSVHTDPHGRIQVRFHWIRPGHNMLTDSAWLRVAYPITHGNAPQGFAVPKVGQEVVVTFLEGDPDRPLVTGIVYKAEKKTDLLWPASATEMAPPVVAPPAVVKPAVVPPAVVKPGTTQP